MTEWEEEFDQRFSKRLEACLSEPMFGEVRPLLQGEVLQRLRSFARLLVKANEQVNLTAIVEPEDVAVKHIADSLLAFSMCEWMKGARVCDVGTGGGVPGLVLASVRPDLRVTLVDSVRKKLRAVGEMGQALRLNVDTEHSRAEEVGRKSPFREGFDVVTARAVARLPVLLELCLPLTRVGGCFVVFKGPDVQSEIENSSLALRRLGGLLEEMREVALPFDAGARSLLRVRKATPTPDEYPRGAGIPAKKPL